MWHFWVGKELLHPRKPKLIIREMLVSIVNLFLLEEPYSSAWSLEALHTRWRPGAAGRWGEPRTETYDFLDLDLRYVMNLKREALSIVVWYLFQTLKESSTFLFQISTITNLFKSKTILVFIRFEKVSSVFVYIGKFKYEITKFRFLKSETCWKLLVDLLV